MIPCALNNQAQLPWLALFLLDIRPHAAVPEKAMAMIGLKCSSEGLPVLTCSLSIMSSRSSM